MTASKKGRKAAHAAPRRKAPHDVQSLRRMAGALVNLWVGMHAYARAETTHAAVKERMLAVLGGGVFQYCWSVKDQTRQPISRDGEGENRLFTCLSQPEQNRELRARCCQTLTMLAERMRAVRKLAVKEAAQSQEGKSLWQGVDAFRRAIWRILDTAVLAGMPASPRPVKIERMQLERLAGILLDRWHVIAGCACSPAGEQETAAQLGRAMGLPIFAGIRAQQAKLAAIGVAGLADWMQENPPGKRRAFYSEVAESLHELGEIASQLRQKAGAASAAGQSPKRFWAAVRVLEITVLEILETGLLAQMGA